MNEKDINLENINQIDLNCNVDLDDDDSFGNISDANNNKESVKTGIIINLSDDDFIEAPKKIISANIDDRGNLNIQKNFNTSNDDYSDPNAIDMECNCYEDEDDEFGTINFENSNSGKTNNKNILDFSDESEEFQNELLSEEMLEEKKRINQGEVEKDYWEKIQKKHLKSDKKGAYNTHFHLTGNPELEKDLFNKEMTVNKDVMNDIKDTFGPSISSDNASSETASSETSAESSGGFGESLNNNKKSDLQKVVEKIGFDLIVNNDGSYIIIDLVDDDNSIECANKKELLNEITPYIDMCILCPLEIYADTDFKNYKEYLNWFDYNKPKDKSFADAANYLKLMEKCFEE